MGICLVEMSGEFGNNLVFCFTYPPQFFKTVFNIFFFVDNLKVLFKEKYKNIIISKNNFDKVKTYKAMFDTIDLNNFLFNNF